MRSAVLARACQQKTAGGALRPPAVDMEGGTRAPAPASRLVERQTMHLAAWDVETGAAKAGPAAAGASYATAPPIATSSLNPPPSPVSPQVAVLHEALMELLAARHLFRAALAAQQERDDAAASAASAA